MEPNHSLIAPGLPEARPPQSELPPAAEGVPAGRGQVHGAIEAVVPEALAKPADGQAPGPEVQQVQPPREESPAPAGPDQEMRHVSEGLPAGGERRSLLRQFHEDERGSLDVKAIGNGILKWTGLSALGRWASPLHAKWREQACKPGTVKSVQDGINTIGAGAAGAWPAWKLALMSGFQNWWFSSGLLGTGAAVVAPVAVVGGGLPLLKRSLAMRHQATMDRLVRGAIVQVQGALSEVEARMILEDLKKELKKLNEREDRSDRSSKPEDLLLQDEKDVALFKSLDLTDSVRADRIPYLGTDERYAEFCYAALIQLCKRVHDNPARVSGLRPGSQELNELSAVQAQICDPDGLDSPAGELAHTRLRCVSVAMGRCLAARERKLREPSNRWSTLGTGAAVSAATGNILPVAAAGAVVGIRALRNRSQAERGQWEITAEGKLQPRGGGLEIAVGANAVRGSALYDPRLVLTKDQLSVTGKAILSCMESLPLPQGWEQARTKEQLAGVLGPSVLSNFPRSRNLPLSIDVNAVKTAKDRLEFRQAELAQEKEESANLKAALPAAKGDPTLIKAIRDEITTVTNRIAIMQNPDPAPAFADSIPNLTKALAKAEKGNPITNPETHPEAAEAFSVYLAEKWEKAKEAHQTRRAARWSFAKGAGEKAKGVGGGILGFLPAPVADFAKNALTVSVLSWSAAYALAAKTGLGAMSPLTAFYVGLAGAGLGMVNKVVFGRK